MVTTPNFMRFMNKKVALVLSILLLGLVFFFVYSLSMTDYINKKELIIANCNKNQKLWIQPTVDSMERWLERLKDTAQKVSTSELYCLFAQELVNANAASAEESFGGVDDLGALVEQLPMMRNVLRDFVQYNSLLGARIVSADGKTLLSASEADPPITEAQKELADQTIKNNNLTLAPIIKTKQGLILNYAVPIAPVMDTGNKPVAALLISLGITSAVDQILSSSPLPDASSPFLLQQQPKGLTVISQITGNILPISSLDVQGKPGNSLPFGLRSSIDDTMKVYSSTQQVPGSNFWIALEIPAQVVQTEIQVLVWQVTGLGVTICLGLGLLIALLWWVFIGREQRAIAERLQTLYNVIAQQKTILDSVNSSLGVGLALIDKGGFIHVANEAFIKIYADPNKLTEPATNLTTAFSGETATQILLQVQTLQAEESQTFEIDIFKPSNDSLPAEEALYRVTMYAYFEKNNKKVLEGAVCVFQDITDFRRKKIEFQSQQRRVIEGLLRVVESVDPYLSGHSAMLQKLAVFMAGHLSLSEKDTAIVSTAAYFSQIGKFYLSKEILLKTDKLTEIEMDMMRQVPVHAYTILKEIDFEMPVAEVVYQMSEQMDGSGYPQGLSGESINLYARILAVANIFCAMTSPRSHRLAFTATQAIEQIKQMNHLFDPKVIDALLAVVQTYEQLHEVLLLKEKPKAFQDEGKV